MPALRNLRHRTELVEQSLLGSTIPDVPRPEKRLKAAQSNARPFLFSFSGLDYGQRCVFLTPPQIWRHCVRDASINSPTRALRAVSRRHRRTLAWHNRYLFGVARGADRNSIFKTYNKVG